MALPPTLVAARRAVALVALSLIAGSCKDANAPADDFKVTIDFHEPTGRPGQVVYPTITATPPRGESVRFIRIIASGLDSRVDSFPITDAGTATISPSYYLPWNATGTLLISATAGDEAHTATVEATLRSIDTLPATLVSGSAEPNAALDTVLVNLQATDDNGLMAVLVHYSGAFTATDSVGGNAALATGITLHHAVPASADFAIPLTVTVDLIDLSPTVTHATLGTFPLSDEAPPVVTSAILGVDGQRADDLSAAAFRPGASMVVRLAATDNHALARVGFSIGSPVNIADSVTVTGSSYSADRPYVITATAPSVASVTFFAVDARGHRTERIANPLSVYDVANRPTVGASLPAGVITDVAVDARRHVAYLAQPDSDRILVLSTTSATFGPPIAAPGHPTGIDLTPSGDTLVVALRRTQALGIVDLATMGPMDTVHLSITEEFPGSHDGPHNVRITSRGEAIVALTLDGSGWDPLHQYTLTTGIDRIRPDAGRDGIVGSDAVLAASGDRSRIVVFGNNSCCPNATQVYDAATDEMSPSVGTTDTYGASISLDQTGDRVLAASSLFDGSLAPLKVFHPPHFNLAHDYVNGTTPTVISPDGSIAYISIGSAYYAVRTSDGAVLEQVFLPATTQRLIPVEGGTRLLSVSFSRADIIDLR